MDGILSSILLVCVIFLTPGKPFIGFIPAERNAFNSHCIFCAFSRLHKMHLLVGRIHHKEQQRNKDIDTQIHKHTYRQGTDSRENHTIRGTYVHTMVQHKVCTHFHRACCTLSVQSHTNILAHSHKYDIHETQALKHKYASTQLHQTITCLKCVYSSSHTNTHSHKNN